MRHTVVVDRGDPTARLVFIGEAPGANEDVQGKAFVGRAGAALDALLEEAGIRKFLIVNVLKCRPPNNKFPGDDGAAYGPEVVDKCIPWLDAQLELVRPRAIILVGGKAASQTIYRGRRMPAVKTIVGRRMHSNLYPGIEIFGMYHTAYMLRLKNYDRPQYDKIREETLQVLKWAKMAIDGDTPPIQPMVVSERRDPGEQLSFF